MRDSIRRVLVYDGDCAMCRRLSRLATWRWLIGGASRQTYDTFEGEDVARLEAAGIRNELAVMDRSTGEIRSGYDGIVWLLRDGRLPCLAALLAFPPLRWLLRHDYRLVAYNRRILAPPRRGIACACEPDLHRGYRWAFIAACLSWTGLFATVGGLAFWTGGSLWGDLPVRGSDAGGIGWTGPLVLTGWVATAAPALRLPSPRGLDYLGHMAWTIAAMVVPLIAAVFLSLLLIPAAMAGVVPSAWGTTPGVPAWIGAVAWGLACPIAMASCLWRLPRLGLSRPIALLVGFVTWCVPTALLILALPWPVAAG